MNEHASLWRFPERLPPRKAWIPYALLAAVTILFYNASFYFEFVWDDFFFLYGNPNVLEFTTKSVKGIWTNTFLGHYAPMHHMFLALVHLFDGTDPFGYHVGQVSLHLLCVLLLYRLLEKLEGRAVAFVASLWFAVYPANIETVAWISESKSTLAMLFFLLSFLAFIRYRETERVWYGALAGVLIVLSMLSKINTVVAPAVFLLYDYRKGELFRKSRLWSLAGFFLLGGIMVIVHLSILHGAAHNIDDLYYGGVGVHLLNFPALLAFYVRMALVPYPLSAYEMFYVEEHWSAAIILQWIGFVCMIWLVARANRTIQFWALWFVIFLLPVLQIIPFPIWVADRYLYIPAIGAFVLVTRLLFWLCERAMLVWRLRAYDAVILVILAANGGYLARHLPVWKNEMTLWTATLPTCSTSAYCNMETGAVLTRNGRMDLGIPLLIRAYELHQTPGYLKYLADAYILYARDARQGVKAYQMLLEQKKDFTADFYATLARAYLVAGDLPAAQQAVASGQKLDPNEPLVTLADTFLQWKLGNRELARAAAERSMALSNHTADMASLLYEFWHDAADVGRVMTDLQLESYRSTLHR